MDAIGFDVMHEEYQEVREEVLHYIEDLHHEETPPPPDSETVSRELNISDTVPVTDSLSSAESELAGRAENNAPANRDSGSSTSSIDSSNKSSTGTTSLYQPGFTAPTITYERDNDDQKLIAIIGREFDCPQVLALSFQQLTSKQANTNSPVAKFVPFTLKRKMLLRGSFDNRELRKHDLICMSYNASEARLLLTGLDGFYTSLLKYVESYLGPNKVAFLISNYTAPHSATQSSTTTSLISPSLKTRLYNQEPLRQYLDEEHVMSWSNEPNESQAERLVQLASLECNPQGAFGNQACCLL